MAPITLLCIAAVVSAAAAGTPLKYMLRDKIVSHQRANGLLRHAESGIPPDMFYTQTLDHFDVTDSRTWQQRYWVNDTFYKPGGNVFLYVEGEGTGSPYDVLEGEHMELAGQYNALVIALEHRYYGASIPTPDLTTPNMAYLSSHQAVGDVARFLSEFVFPTWNVNPAAGQKVVTFGGSYPGALSAWLRLRLPHLISIAVSTSSPIQAQLDFTAYNGVVNASLSKTSIGGSSACAEATRAAFTVMDAAFQAGGIAKDLMAVRLNSCTNLTGVNDTMWAASNYAGAIQTIVQYNGETGPYDVAAYCTQMTTEANDPITNLALALPNLVGTSCVDNSYADFVASAGSTVANPSAQGVGIRQWTWQTCTQFGYYQTCEDRNTCPLSLYMTLDSNTQQCTDLYGQQFTAALNANRVLATNDMLGGTAIAMDRIIFVNGNVDPWHALSLYNSSNSAARPSVFIDGTAHCRNMQPSRPDDPPALVAARQQINAYLAAFMASA